MSITHRQRRMLGQIGETYLSVKQLTDELGTSWGSTYATATELVRKDYLRLVSRDGMTHYTITPKGAKILREPYAQAQ